MTVLSLLIPNLVLAKFVVPPVEPVLASPAEKTTRTILSVDVQDQECRNIRLARINGIPRLGLVLDTNGFVMRVLSPIALLLSIAVASGCCHRNACHNSGHRIWQKPVYGCSQCCGNPVVVVGGETPSDGAMEASPIEAPAFDAPEVGPISGGSVDSLYDQRKTDGLEIEAPPAYDEPASDLRTAPQEKVDIPEPDDIPATEDKSSETPSVSSDLHRFESTEPARETPTESIKDSMRADVLPESEDIMPEAPMNDETPGLSSGARAYSDTYSPEVEVAQARPSFANGEPSVSQEPERSFALPAEPERLELQVKTDPVAKPLGASVSSDPVVLKAITAVNSMKPMRVRQDENTRGKICPKCQGDSDGQRIVETSKLDPVYGLPLGNHVQFSDLPGLVQHDGVNNTQAHQVRLGNARTKVNVNGRGLVKGQQCVCQHCRASVAEAKLVDGFAPPAPALINAIQPESAGNWTGAKHLGKNRLYYLPPREILRLRASTDYNMPQPEPTVASIQMRDSIIVNGTHLLKQPLENAVDSMPDVDTRIVGSEETKTDEIRKALKRLRPVEQRR